MVQKLKLLLRESPYFAKCMQILKLQGLIKKIENARLSKSFSP